MDTTPEPTEPDEGPATDAKGCPNDTDGDGNCGRVACPHCGKYRYRVGGLVIDPQRDISETPAPQRNVDTY